MQVGLALGRAEPEKWKASCAVTSCPLSDPQLSSARPARPVSPPHPGSGKATCLQQRAFCKLNLKLGDLTIFPKEPSLGWAEGHWTGRQGAQSLLSGQSSGESRYRDVDSNAGSVGDLE